MTTQGSTATKDQSGDRAEAIDDTARKLHKLNAAGYLRDDTLPALEAVAHQFAVAITPRMLDVIDPQNPDDPVARQFLPDVRELECHHEERTDPIGDERFSPLPGIVHRYPDRALLLPLKVCPVYCRFCFRRETIGTIENGLLSSKELQNAIDYIRKHTEIWEVILSGGDPLMLSPRRLERILLDLRSIDHVRVIRIHSRVPLVAPERISQRVTQVLRAALPVFVVLHCNHPREFTEAGALACAQLVDAGIPMLSQTVLLRGINDDIETMTALLRLLVEHRIKPYYLHHGDQARGTGHFRTRITTGQELVARLHGNVSGICQPTYVLDIPGGYGKTPIGPNYLANGSDGAYCVTDYRGRQHVYNDTRQDSEFGKP